MSREKKKGTSGNAKAFITRAKALQKLQLTLPEFRRLCILKGIYPRDPRKKLQGADKTYYLTKDIDFLAHERLISTIRNQNAHKKKVVKARAKRRIDILKRLHLSAPKSRLDHLVVERYPHFTDALRELDDPLCIIALFANLPADHKVGIAPARVANCQRLLKEFYQYIVTTNALRRVFVSIKGYYFQASVAGEAVTWISPHRFSQILPADVDYSVMLTFLELYECVMAFVNFRLYTSQNLAYPPKILRNADANALELPSLKLSKSEPQAVAPDNTPASVSDQAVRAAEEVARATAEDESDNEGDEGSADPNVSLKNEAGEPEAGEPDADDASKKPMSAIFDGKSIVLGREVPYTELEFALLATGAKKVTREDDLPDSNSVEEYTHWIIDRPKIAGERNMSLEYVQPQYVFDSINATVLLPTALYAPGTNLPPHLSPFVTEQDDGGYRPWFKDVIERIKSGDSSVVGEAAAVMYAEAEVRMQKETYSKKGTDSARDISEAKFQKTNASPNRSNAVRKASEDTQDQDSLTVGGIEDNKKASAQTESLSDEPGTAAVTLENDSRKNEEGMAEDDEEGEDESMSKQRQENTDKEGKEMATLMLSRKKMRQYKRQKREEEKKAAVKHKLSEKRKKLDEERSSAIDRKRKRTRTT